MPRASQNYNLQILNPNLAKEWHPTKNGELVPQDVTPGSKKKVWWVCKKRHEWLATICDRNNGSGCPYCSGNAVCDDNCLAIINPQLAKEWHPTKNGELTPHYVTSGSKKKVWWICKKKHEWLAAVQSRSRGTGCPYCCGKAASEDNCLATVNPQLAKEWHPAKNGDLTPYDVTPNSSKKVWWICKREHGWIATPNARSTGGTGCPYCSGNAVCDDNCLATVNPQLANEWHSTKNGDLTPNDVTPGSNKKVWWICKREHEWIAAINDRNNGSGCPSCNSKTSQLELRIYSEFKVLFKKVINRKKVNGHECDIFIPKLNIGVEIDGVYWHKDKNDQDIEKTKFFENVGISFLRLRERGLKKLNQNDIIFSKKDNDFQLIKKILKHFIKHVNLPNDTKVKIIEYLKNGKIVNDEEYLKLLYKLPSPIPGYSLYDINRSLASEWHPTKNGALTPRDVTPNSHKKVWWICKKNKEHEWLAVVSSRNRGLGCPYCSGKAVCDDNCLATVNPKLAKEWHPTKNRNLTPKDFTPNSNKKVWWICDNKHSWIAAIDKRNRGSGCPYCSGKAVCNDNCLATLNPKLAKEWHPTKNGALTPRDVTTGSDKKIWWICKKNLHHDPWRATVYDRNKGSGCPYCDGKAVCDDNCLAKRNPQLAKEWHPTKNGHLTPNDVTPGSNKKVWWICKKNLHHDPWRATVKARSNGTGCPACRRLSR